MKQIKLAVKEDAVFRGAIRTMNGMHMNDKI